MAAIENAAALCSACKSIAPVAVLATHGAVVYRAASAVGAGATLAEGAFVMGTLAFLPSRLVDHFGLSVAQAGGVMVIYGASGLVYSHFARQSLALLGEKGLAWLGGGLIVFSMATLALANEPALAIGACALAGLGFYMMHNTLQTQATQMAPQARSMAVTLFACTLFFGQTLGVAGVARSLDAGWMSETFYSQP